ncbi:MAG: YncE family protein [Planctomycetes bacterium]|nr:YncE family protein [Planctomycetota bacterium]
MKSILHAAGAIAALVAPALAQNVQVSAVAVQPNAPNRVWVCNKDNGTVACIDVNAPAILAEIPVGVHPRSLAFSPDGARLFVANQRGNVPIDRNFVTPFNGTEMRGTISVIDVAGLAVQTTLSNVGTEAYGVAVSPNGKYFVVSGHRSATLKFYDVQTLAPLASLQYQRNLNDIPAPFTMADVDANRDGIADLDTPRGFTIRADSTRMYVTHTRSPYVSIVDVTLNGAGLPTAATLFGKIDLDDYPFDPVFNPVPVQTVQSQGKPRFAEDIALSPDGTKALVPHLLHNVNHDVNHDFGPGFPGAFANRIYPALTVVDTALNSYGAPGDASRRLHHELSDPAAPAQYVPFGRSRRLSRGDLVTLGGEGSPVGGGSASFVIDGLAPGDTATLFLGRQTQNLPLLNAGVSLVRARVSIPMVNGRANVPLRPGLTDFTIYAQVLVQTAGGELGYSNALRVYVNPTGFGQNKLGYRAGHPHRALFNAAGDRALVLNRGSEDVFLYKVAGNNLELMNVFPPRLGFVPRPPLDTASATGDLPLGWALEPDPSTVNDDANLYIVNEVTRTLSVLRVDYTTGTIHKAKEQIPTHQGADALTLSQRIGQELFEDASRPQTTGNFNNSCASCHFEGGEDGNVWQRPAGPRSTMPMYGGTLGTGLILWKGVRLNSGETGPMFGGENGGTGVFTDAQQQGLVDYHEVLAFPLNPNLDPVTGQYSSQAAFGKDLYFGTNTTGLNPTGRNAGCVACHPDVETNPFANPGPRFYTADFLDPALTHGETLAGLDPDCVTLRENFVTINMRNVNSGANVDVDGDTFPDPDRNFDGIDDRETYVIMNIDKDDPFLRDDHNSYLCPCDPQIDPNCDVNNPFRQFSRSQVSFSIPTKLGVFSTAPYFHDHGPVSLRALLDPESQAISPVYGSPAFPLQTPYPGLTKHFNEVHDVRGHQQIVPNSSKVQTTLQSGTVAQTNADLEALLAYIQSL